MRWLTLLLAATACNALIPDKTEVHEDPGWLCVNDELPTELLVETGVTYDQCQVDVVDWDCTVVERDGKLLVEVEVETYTVRPKPSDCGSGPGTDELTISCGDQPRLPLSYGGETVQWDDLPLCFNY